MQNGLAIIEQIGESTKSVFIDQEVLECARLNMRTKQRLNVSRKAKATKARFNKYTAKTARCILIESASAVALLWLGSAEMIHPGLWIPAAIILLCAACVRLGMWLGRAAKK